MIVVSKCLIGENCKYDGTNNFCPEVMEFLKDKDYVSVCPEMLGGLGCPRKPAEIKGDKVINSENKDVTENFVSGAEKALEIALKNKATLAILKESSPSCGGKTIYSGNFDGKKIKGTGITAKLFKEKGIKVISEKDVM